MHVDRKWNEVLYEEFRKFTYTSKLLDIHAIHWQKYRQSGTGDRVQISSTDSLSNTTTTNMGEDRNEIKQEKHAAVF